MAPNKPFQYTPANITAGIAMLKSRSSPNENGCWLWSGKLVRAGYGSQFSFLGHRSMPHNLACRLRFRGDLPAGHQAAHGVGCQKACVNPEHMTPKLQADNQADRVLDGTDNRGSKCLWSKI